MTQQLISADQLSVSRRGKTILHPIDLTVGDGEFLAIVGPSGAGKSTLLQVLSGALKPSTGQIRFADRPLHRWNPRCLARQRALLPQSSSLNFSFPVLEVVLMGLSPYADDTPGDIQQNRALNALNKAGVIHLADRDYATLSGGERQRVQFARVLAQLGLERRDRRLLLLDEPTASLDLAHAWQVLSTARQLTDQAVAVICVLHDLNLAASFADRIIILKQGAITARGAPRQVLTGDSIAGAFGIAVDVIDHPSQDTPLIAVRPDSVG